MDIPTILLSAFNVTMTVVACSAAVGFGIYMERHFPAEVAVAQDRSERYVAEAQRIIQKQMQRGGGSEEEKEKHIHVADDGCVFGHLDSDPKKKE